MRSNVNNLRTNMKKILLCGLTLSIILFLLACGTGKEPVEDTPQPVTPKPTVVEQEEPDPSPEQEAIEDEQKQRIRAVIISPVTPRADSRITVTADIFPALDTEEGESLSYMFYKNTEIFREQEENSLPPRSVAKGDSIFADVILSSGGFEVDKKRSSIIIVLNSKPEIGEIEFPAITGLGTYTITVNASDADEDKLIYSLDKGYGIPVGMTISDTTGLITYEITKAPEKDVKFKVKVGDGDGGEDWREYFIKFSQTPAKKEK